MTITTALAICASTLIRQKFQLQQSLAAITVGSEMAFKSWHQFRQKRGLLTDQMVTQKLVGPFLRVVWFNAAPKYGSIQNTSTAKVAVKRV